jgi:hypothetical protein
MTNAMTNQGQSDMLYGTATPNGGIANLGTKIKLYDASSTPNVNGTGFTETSNGNGYTTGGMALTRPSYTYSVVSTSGQIVIANQTWTATGTISTIAGAMLTDASDAVLAWWARSSSVTLNSGDTLTLTSLTISLS